MNIKTKTCLPTGRRKNKLIYLTMLTVLSGSASFLFWQKGKADSGSVAQLSQTTTTDETQQKIDELQRRADIYRQIIDIKKKQGETLNNQLAITDTSIQQVQAQIEVSKQQIDDYNSQIIRIEAQIKEKESIIERQKGILANLVQSYYEVNLASPIVSYLSGGNLASFMVSKDRLGQTGDKIKGLVDSIKGIKADLEAQSAELDKKKGESVTANDKLQSQGTDLESAKAQKANLLAQTKGEEVRYSDLLARVEQQKQELLNIDQFFAASGLSIDSYPKPASVSFAPTNWYFSQRDPAWGDATIGNTKTLMKSYGCAVTAVAMVMKEHGGSDTPGTLAKKPMFSGDLINWPSTWANPKVSLVSSLAHSSSAVDWSIIDAQIAKGNPVIVYVGKTNGGGGHYVVIHHKESSTGKYVVHDPYFGPNIYLDTTRALVGAMGSNGNTRIDQMIIYN